MAQKNIEGPSIGINVSRQRTPIPTRNKNPQKETTALKMYHTRSAPSKPSTKPRSKSNPTTAPQLRTHKSFHEPKIELIIYLFALLEDLHAPPNGSDVTDLEDAGTKRYPGSCHCGAVTFDLDSKPLEDLEPWSCNCSICARVCLPPAPPNPPN